MDHTGKVQYDPPRLDFPGIFTLLIVLCGKMGLVLYLGMSQDFLVTFKGVCSIFIMLDFFQCPLPREFKDKGGGLLS